MSRLLRLGELLAGHLFPALFEELEQRFGAKPALGDVVAAIEGAGLGLDLRVEEEVESLWRRSLGRRATHLEEEVEAASADFWVDGLTGRRVVEAADAVLLFVKFLEQVAAPRQLEQLILVAAAVDPVGPELDVRVAVRRRVQPTSVPDVVFVFHLKKNGLSSRNTKWASLFLSNLDQRLLL